MSRNPLLSRTVRGILLSAAAAGFAASPVAQAADENIQEIVVTGSRIQRQDYESASPIVTVNEDAFQKSGTTTVETLLNTLPQFVPSLTNTSNNPSNGGQANVELRGLGTSRTLVLLDGKRVVPANATGVVDLNMLPSSLIKSVEIISGGASAVYGSDAVAGVVNFKTKDYDGFEINSDWGQTAKSDGEEYQVGVTGGTTFASGRGKIIGNLAYAKRDQVLAGARDFGKTSLKYGGPGVGFLPAGSPTIREGRVSVAASQAAVDQVFGKYGVPAGTETTRVFGFNNDGSLFSLGDDETPGSVRNFRGDGGPFFNDQNFAYNFGPENYLQLPLERKTGFVRGSFEISPAAEVYAQGLWANYTADLQLAPTPGTTLFVPVTNQFIPADLATLLASRSNPTAPFQLTKRLSEMGPRTDSSEYDVYQVTAGIKGQVFDNWSYDAYGSFGKVKVDNPQLGSISRSKFEQLTFAPDGGQALCGGFNPFGIGSISQKCADFLRVDADNHTDVKQTIGEASLTGPLFGVPAGQVQGAFGVFYKKDQFAFVADDKLRAQTTNEFGLPIRPDVTGFNATNNVIGETHSTELYTEILVPLLADLPGVKKLDATLGYRYADYSTVGGVNSYKAELTYQPATPFLVRSSYQRAVRAPNILELFQPQVTNFPAISPPDPCSVGSDQRKGANAAGVRALCLAQGLPAGLIDNYSFTAGQVNGLQGGNPNLHEETADTMTFGVVLRSMSENPWLSSLQLSVDWYRINITNAITAVTASTFVDRCYDTQYNPTLSANNFYCNFFGRDAGTGEIAGAAELQQNIGATQTTGVDVQLDWAADVGPGRAGVNWVVSWLDKWDQQELPGDPFTHYAQTIGNNVAQTFPEWKWTFNASYDVGGVGLNARWRYVGGMDDFNVPAFAVPATSYLDAGANYSFGPGSLEGLVLRAGVTNLTDKQPQIYPSFVQSNTDPSTYDVLGRRYFLSANYSFK